MACQSDKQREDEALLPTKKEILRIISENEKRLGADKVKFPDNAEVAKTYQFAMQRKKLIEKEIGKLNNTSE